MTFCDLVQEILKEIVTKLQLHNVGFADESNSSSGNHEFLNQIFIILFFLVFGIIWHIVLKAKAKFGMGPRAQACVTPHTVYNKA